MQLFSFPTTSYETYLFAYLSLVLLFGFREFIVSFTPKLRVLHTYMLLACSKQFVSPYWNAQHLHTFSIPQMTT